VLLLLLFVYVVQLLLRMLTQLPSWCYRKTV